MDAQTASGLGVGNEIDDDLMADERTPISPLGPASRKALMGSFS